MKILGIETSCDETSAAVIDVDDDSKKITLLSNIISSSADLHAKTGGIIPEIAAREQLKYIIPVIDQAFNEAKSDHDDIDSIAVTVGPGLIGSLIVGVETAKTLSYVWNKPIIPVNHLYGHIYANFISDPSASPQVMTLERQTLRDDKEEISFPAIALIVSGGHTDLVLMKDEKALVWISGTRDDAAGEAFDKVGRLLGLTYPAGPIIEKLAKKGNPKRFKFPRPLIHENTLDFSFSGLKTAVLREVQKIARHSGASAIESHENLRGSLESDDSRVMTYRSANASLQDDIFLDNQTICDLAFATQDAIIDVLINKTSRAVEKYNAKSILLGGGVAANQTLNKSFQNIVDTKFFVPAKNLCTDNAAMIAAGSFFHYNPLSWEKIESNPELYFD